MTGMEDELIAALYRVNCPDSVELGEYQLGLAEESQLSLIKHHLTECPYCAREVAQLEAFMAQVEPDLEYTIVERIKVWIARLVPESDAGDGAGQPVASHAFALRGESDGPIQYEAGEARLTIDIQEDPQRPGRKSLFGLIMGIDPAGGQAHLWKDGNLVTTAAIDNLGNFIISDLTPGKYELIAAVNSVEIHVQELPV
jgi:hypothetical protein